MMARIKPRDRFGPMGGGTYADRAKERWGSEIADWVIALASAADSYAEQSKGMVMLAEFLGCNPSVLIAAIGHNYRGRYDHVEQLVRGKLMSEAVMCDPLGMTLPRDVCAQNQKRKPSSVNPMTAKFPAACRTCPNATGGSDA
jgi:hypothetical protein